METNGLKAELAERLEKALDEASLLTPGFVGSPAAAARERQKDNEREREKEREQEREKERKEKRTKRRNRRREEGNEAGWFRQPERQPLRWQATIAKENARQWPRQNRSNRQRHKGRAQTGHAAEVAAEAGAKAAESVLAPMSAQLQTLTDMLQQQQQVISEGQKSRESALVPYGQTPQPDDALQLSECLWALKVKLCNECEAVTVCDLECVD
jgi:hypothetical protein